MAKPTRPGIKGHGIPWIVKAASTEQDLTRIRPNYCVFKGVFFGSNPLVECQTPQNRGHGSEFTDSAQTRQSETARSCARRGTERREGINETELIPPFILLAPGFRITRPGSLHS